MEELLAEQDIEVDHVTVGLSVTGDRPVRAGHRCADLAEAGPGSYCRFCTHASEHGPRSTEVSIDHAPVGPRVLDASDQYRALLVQNLRRSHYELGVDVDSPHQLPAAFTEFALAI